MEALSINEPRALCLRDINLIELDWFTAIRTVVRSVDLIRQWETVRQSTSTSDILEIYLLSTL